jgi:hypothetical protein
VWESNPPFPLLAGNTGFEVQAGHQNPMRSQWCCPLIILNFSRKRNFFLCHFSLDCDQTMSHMIATLVKHHYGRAETLGCMICIMLGGLDTSMTHHIIDSIKISTCLPGW